MGIRFSKTGDPQIESHYSTRYMKLSEKVVE